MVLSGGPPAVCLIILLTQIVNYYDSPMTTKSTIYSLDLNLNDIASWKKESTWFDSADQSIGMSAFYKHDNIGLQFCQKSFKKLILCN